MGKGPGRQEIMDKMARLASQRTRSPSTPKDAQEPSPPKHQPPKKKDRPNKRPKYQAFQENTKGDKPVLKGAGVYGKPEARPDEDSTDDEEADVGDDPNQGSGNESDDNQYKVPRGTKGDMKKALPACGTYGSITNKERQDFLLKMKVYKRGIIEQNLTGPWADAKFYATGDEMVCQFVEAAFPEVLDPDAPIGEQIQAAGWFLGDVLYKTTRKTFQESMNSRQSELSAGATGLKRAAAATWGVVKLESEEGPEVAAAFKRSLLKDDRYHIGRHDTPLADPLFMSIIKSVFKTTDITIQLLSWSMVVIEEWFEGNKMENDHTANMRKILARGGTVRAALLNLNKRQKRVERVEVLVAEDYAHRRVAEVVVAANELLVKRKEKRGMRLDLSVLDISAQENAAMKALTSGGKSEGDGTLSDDDLSDGDLQPKKRLRMSGEVETPEERSEQRPSTARSGEGSRKTDEPGETLLPEGNQGGSAAKAPPDAQGPSRSGRCTTPPPEDLADPEPAPNCESHSPSRRVSAAGMSRDRESLPTDVTSQVRTTFTDEEEATLNAIENGPKNKTILLKHAKEDITREMALAVLSGGWVTCEVVNVFTALLKEREVRANTVLGKNFPRCYFFSSYFYTALHPPGNQYSSKKAWDGKYIPHDVDFMAFDKLIVPINQRRIHWALALVDIAKETLEYFDSSMVGGEPVYRESEPDDVLSDLGEFLKELCLKKRAAGAKKGKKDATCPNSTEWSKVVHTDLPQQQDGSSCGVFMLKFADYISRGASEFDFTQDNMPHYRRRIIVDIINNKVS